MWKYFFSESLGQREWESFCCCMAVLAQGPAVIEQDEEWSVFEKEKNGAYPQI